MKLENCNIGDVVKVKKSNSSFSSENVGRVGVITGVDTNDTNVTVRIAFDNDYGKHDWGVHTDLKLIEKSTLIHLLGK